MATWAYQVENFQPAPDEELVCIICRGVFKDPTQTLCRHTFCRSCIMQWLNRSRTCPVCREANRPSTVIPAPFMVCNLIAKLRVKCPSCNGAPMSIENANEHRCPEAHVRCGDCRLILRRSALAYHRQRTCEARSELCPHCQIRIPPVDVADSAYPARLPKHDCIKVLKGKLKEQSKEMTKRIKELEDKVKGLEGEIYAAYRTSFVESSSDDDSVSNSYIPDDFELVVDIDLE